MVECVAIPGPYYMHKKKVYSYILKYSEEGKLLEGGLHFCDSRQSNICKRLEKVLVPSLCNYERAEKKKKKERVNFPNLTRITCNYITLHKEAQILEQYHPIKIVLYEFIIIQVLISCTACSNTTWTNKYL
jgi:hypothetical protein